MRTKFLLFCCFFLFSYLLRAQSDTIPTASTLSEFSLEELMNIPIYSASKTEEPSFDAPLTSYVITHEQMKKAGCTTIMEALRLAPGLIVREQSNGNYDVHIRGLDNVPPNSSMYFFQNTTTLVMIDNRPVYNYLHGGTFWETLPITLSDVEQIEIVEGPSSAMYGPNAESGVINIITRKPEKKGLFLNATGMYGRFNTGIANASVGYKFNDKISLYASGNFQTRERTNKTYYVLAQNQFVSIDSFIPNDSLRNLRYPHPNLSMRKYGYNLFFNYRINDRANLAIQGGGQNSEVQNLFAANYFTTAQSKSYYANLRAQLYGLDLQVAYLMGTQTPNVGVVPWKWDLNTTDVMLSYKIDQVKNLIITPGLTYRRASYDDRKYVDENIRQGFFNANVITQSIAASLRADYSAFHNTLRLIAAARMDKFFNGPSKLQWSWQFAVTYKPTPKHILRIVESRANRSPLIVDNFLNEAFAFNSPLTGGAGYLELLGNKDLKLLQTDMLEIGYRGKIKDNVEIDLVAFGSQTRNFSNIIYEGSFYDSANARRNFTYKFENLTIWARQIGGTISLNMVFGKFQIKPYLTIQYTTLFDYSPYAVSPTADSTYFTPKNPATNNVNSGLGKLLKHEATPAAYGGAYIDCQATPQLDFNLHPYFLSTSKQLEASNLTYNDGIHGVQNMSPKFIMDVTVSYTFFKRLTLSMMFKNCFSDKSREFFKGDIPGFKVLGGVNFEF